MAEPRGNPSWSKGMASPNPGGWPKNRFEFAKTVAEATKGGLAMIKVALHILLSDGEAASDRLRAAEFLCDRMIGKAPQVIELHATVKPDLSKLSDQELEAYHALAIKALPAPEEPK